MKNILQQQILPKVLTEPISLIKKENPFLWLKALTVLKTEKNVYDIKKKKKKKESYKYSNIYISRMRRGDKPFAYHHLVYTSVVKVPMYLLNVYQTKLCYTSLF